MTTYLLVISFILHFIIVLVLLVLFQRKGVQRANIPSMQEDVETIHESIEAFVDEMEKENRELYEALVQHVNQKEAWAKDRWTELDKKITHLDATVQSQSSVPSSQQEFNLEAKMVESYTQPLQSVQETADEPPVDDIPQANQTDDGLTSFEENLQKAEDMYKQGFTAVQIAKLLRIGNGEAQLIVHMLQRK